MSVKDWTPRKSDPNNPTPRESLQRYLKLVRLIGGEGSIELGERGPVYVAIAHDASSYHPDGAIVVDQNPFHDLEDAVLTTAFEIVEERVMENEVHVKDIQEEWGDQWREILTEAFDGAVWTFNDPYEASAAIVGDPEAMRHIEINDPEPEE